MVPVLTSIAAHLYVADIDIACDFFQGKLGFTLDFVYGEPPFYAQVSRDHAKLALRHLDEPVFADDIRDREQLLSASITVATHDEIQSLFKTCEDERVSFHQRLKNEPWGATTFVVKDPDGNLLLFAGPVS